MNARLRPAVRDDPHPPERQAGWYSSAFPAYARSAEQGASAMMLIAPGPRAGVVVLINSDAAGASALATRLLEIALGLPPRDRTEIAVDPKVYDNYIGNYEATSVVMTVSRANDRLFVQFPRQQKIQIFPENVRDYFLKTFDTQITFVTDSSGRANELIMHEGGTDLYAKRIK
jgi:hypothetical protein